MKNKKYTISELHELTKVTPRTIHFYTKKGLISPPEGFGRGAKYNEKTYLQLKLIKELQKSRSKLSEIKKYLKGKKTEEMRDLVDRIPEHKPVSDKETLNNWVKENLFGKSIVHEKISIDESFSFLNIGKEQEKPKTNRPPKFRLSQKDSLPRSSWTRIMISDGIELNIRSDVKYKHETMISRFIQDLKKNIKGR